MGTRLCLVGLRASLHGWRQLSAYVGGGVRGTEHDPYEGEWKDDVARTIIYDDSFFFPGRGEAQFGPSKRKPCKQVIRKSVENVVVNAIWHISQPHAGGFQITSRQRSAVGLALRLDPTIRMSMCSWRATCFIYPQTH